MLREELCASSPLGPAVTVRPLSCLPALQRLLGLLYDHFDRDGNGCDYGEFCRVFYDRRTKRADAALQKKQAEAEAKAIAERRRKA